MKRKRCLTQRRGVHGVQYKTWALFLPGPVSASPRLRDFATSRLRVSNSSLPPPEKQKNRPHASTSARSTGVAGCYGPRSRISVGLIFQFSVASVKKFLWFGCRSLIGGHVRIFTPKENRHLVQGCRASRRPWEGSSKLAPQRALQHPQSRMKRARTSLKRARTMHEKAG